MKTPGRLPVVGLMVGARVVILPAILFGMPARSAGDSEYGHDTIRYQQIATTPGRPYRDFEVEIPPVELGVVDAIHVEEIARFWRRLASFSPPCLRPEEDRLVRSAPWDLPSLLMKRRSVVDALPEVRRPA